MHEPLSLPHMLSLIELRTNMISDDRDFAYVRGAITALHWAGILDDALHAKLDQAAITAWQRKGEHSPEAIAEAAEESKAAVRH